MNTDKHQGTQIYLTSLLTKFESYILLDQDKKLIARDLKSFIIQKISRKKFRKQKLFDNALEDITKKVELSIKGDKPLHFTIPFGGYKHFWNPSHPEADWAELFTFKFLSEWVSPILAAYKPGVIIEFISEDLILPRMNNYPDEVLEHYAKSFRALLDEYKKYVPGNLDIKFFRVGERFNKEKIVEGVESILPESWKKWETYTQEEKEIELKRSRRSVFWNGKIDLTNLTDEDKERKMIESRLIELAYYDTEAKPEFLGNYFMEDNHIGVCFSFGTSPDNFDHWLTLGSTFASVVDFWIGRGILEEKSDGSFVKRIVSKEQYMKIKDSLRTEKISIPELDLKNWQSIEILNDGEWDRIAS